MSLRMPLIVWGVAAGCALLLLALIFAAPSALSHRHPLIGSAIYQIFRPFCHQIPARSFYFEGHPLAVCARCSGLYIGFAVGALLYPLVRSLRRSDAPARAWLIAAALPTATDFALGFSGIWANTHLSRSVTGALLGAVVAFFVVPGLVDASRINWRQFFASRVPLERNGVPAIVYERTGERAAPSD